MMFPKIVQVKSKRITPEILYIVELLGLFTIASYTFLL